MNTKHTPGPWFLSLKHDNKKIIEIDNGSLEDDRIWMVLFHAKDAEVQLANARLISAAPELLEALIDLNRAIDKYWNGTAAERQQLETLICERYKLSKMAIAKALGGSGSC